LLCEMPEGGDRSLRDAAVQHQRRPAMGRTRNTSHGSVQAGQSDQTKPVGQFGRSADPIDATKFSYLKQITITTGLTVKSRSGCGGSGHRCLLDDRALGCTTFDGFTESGSTADLRGAGRILLDLGERGALRLTASCAGDSGEKLAHLATPLWKHLSRGAPFRPPAAAMYGESAGHYDGDTLVVDTIGFTDKWTSSTRCTATSSIYSIAAIIRRRLRHGRASPRTPAPSISPSTGRLQTDMWSGWPHSPEFRPAPCREPPRYW
jgi:hypothetical protein